MKTQQPSPTPVLLLHGQLNLSPEELPPSRLPRASWELAVEVIGISCQLCPAVVSQKFHSPVLGSQSSTTITALPNGGPRNTLWVTAPSFSHGKCEAEALLLIHGGEPGLAEGLPQSD